MDHLTSRPPARKYSVAFKQKVIQEFMEGGVTMQQLLHKYDIRGNSAILNWMRRLNYISPLESDRRIFAAEIGCKVAKKIDPQEENQLKQRIRELERQLEDEKLKAEAYARIIDRAEKELNIPIRKKPNTR